MTIKKPRKRVTKKSKPILLSKEDYAELQDLMKSKDIKGPILYKILDYLRRIEKKYEIKDFDFKYYIPRETKNGFELSGFFNDNPPIHAVWTYFTLFVWFLSKEFEDKNKYFEKFYNFCWHHINRLDKIIISDKDSYLTKTTTFLFLDYLRAASDYNDDTTTLIKAYHKALSLYKLFKNYSFFDAKLDSFTVNYFGESFAGFLNKRNGYFYNQSDIFASNAKLIECFIKGITYANDDEPCLIIGETGTGKEEMARMIHLVSKRRENNFKAINVGGFNESLFSSEIQGQHWSAATGIGTRLGACLSACGREKRETGKNAIGYYVIPNKQGKGEIRFKPKSGESGNKEPTQKELDEVGGVLFMDEINSIPIGLQAKLLRIIQEKEVQVTGEDRTRRFQAKIICATNSNLMDAISKGEFREDLYYRVSRGIIELPPLRDMMDSFDEMVDNRIFGLTIKGLIKKNTNISKSALKKLKSHNWPGNIRELENVLYMASKEMIKSRDKEIKPDHIYYLKTSKKDNDNKLDFTGMSYNDVKRKYAEYLFHKFNGNQTKAKNAAGYVSRSQIKVWWKEHYGLIE